MLGVVRNRLRPPRAGSGVIPRLRLRDLVAASSAGVLVVEADAGYGKTTAADELTAGSRRLWYGLTAADRDPSVFVAHLVAAFDEVAGTRGTSPAPRGERRSAVRTWPEELDRLVDRMETGGTIPSFLVLDDYHHVHGSSVDEVVGALLERLPREIRVVITTRVRLLLPGWARGRARGDILDVGRSVLAFDAGETRQYFETTFDTRLTAAQAALLTEETEGWPIGLSLIGRQVRDRDLNPEVVLAHLPEGRRHIFDFLGEQVFSDQPQDVRAFLLAVSGLPVLDAEACAAVAGTGTLRAQELLTAISRGGVFCTGHGEGPYRLHHLFRDFLRAQLAPEQRDDLDARAAAHYRSRGMSEAAARFATRAGQPAQAARDVADVAPQLIDTGRHLTLLDLSDPLGDALDEHPGLRVQRSHALRLTSRYGEAVQEARQAAQAGRGDDAVLIGARFAEALVHLDTVTPAAAAPPLSALLRHGARRREGPDAVLLTMLAEQQVNAGRLALAGHTLDRLAARGIDDEGTRRTAVRLLARRGELHRARAALEVTAPSTPRRVSSAHRENAALLSWVHGLLGHGDEAEERARVGIALAEDLRSPILSCVCWGRLGLAQLTTSPDDVSLASESLRRAQSLAEEMSAPRFRAEPLIGLTLAAHRTGRSGDTVRYGTEAVAMLEATGDRYLRAVATLAVGVGLTRSGNPEAGPWLEAASRRARRVGDAYTALMADQWAAWRALCDRDQDRFAAHAVPAVRATAALALDDVWGTPPWLGIGPSADREAWLEAARRLPEVERYASYLLTRAVPRQQPAAGASAPGPASVPRIRIRTLGGFQATRLGDGAPLSWPRRKAMEILWLLCSSPSHSVGRDEVLGRLWPDEDPEVAGLRFRVSLHALHLVLEPDRPQRSATRVVRTTPDRLWLAPDAVELDVDRFRELADEARRRSGPAALQAALTAVELYEGPFLVEAPDRTWAAAARDELAAVFRDLVVQAATALVDRREFGRAAALGRRLLEQDPFSEPAYRVVVGAHLAAGDRAAAERAYADCRHHLLAELGVEPGWCVDDLERGRPTTVPTTP